MKGNKLFIDQRDASEIAEEYGTPLFLYSKHQMCANFHRLQNIFKKAVPVETRVYYAMKANYHPELLATLKEEDVWIDAVSPGEALHALRIGFPGEKILFTGTSVSDRDIQILFNLDGVVVNIDAEEQLETMRERRERQHKNKRVEVFIRWNPGIGRGFSPKTVTAGEKTLDGTPIKFGIEENQTIRIFQKAAEYGFKPVGLHQHLGSGWRKDDFDVVRSAVDKMIRKAVELSQEGFALEILDFGGGFGPRYSEDQEPFPIKEYAEYIGKKLDQSGLTPKAIAIEPGKFLVGDAGVLLLRVEYIKKSYGNHFACVNGGTFNTVPRPAIYTQAQHHIVNCARVEAKRLEKITVPGNLCETGDVFRKEIWMPTPEKGDILALLCAGAYCRSMASNFNLREIPKEVVI
ncbi:MAG: diaminopimelate decarboxylase [Candidatus Aminicenantes bacterium]|nr:diaminopimelate decarboxylase [Candidatus Aminicenantes bacterium]